MYSISFGREIGIVTVENNLIANLFIEGQYQANGFGIRLLEYAFSCTGTDAYMEIPKEHAVLLHICKKIGLRNISNKSIDLST